MEQDMTQGKPLAIILKFTLPLLVGNIFQQFYNMADTIIVDRFVGANALAARGLHRHSHVSDHRFCTGHYRRIYDSDLTALWSKG